VATILVTGANRGLGLEFTKQYAADGWEVIAATRNPGQATELGKLAGKNVILNTLDVTSDESVQDLADALDGRPIDLLLHNSGVYPREGQKIGELDYEGWRDAMETNLFGVFRLTEALLDNVAASQRKQIAAISTGMASFRSVQSGTVPAGWTSYQYRTSKTALNMGLSVLAKELAPRGISVVMIDPGWVKTDMGGPNAQLTTEQSIAGIRKVLSGSPMEMTGKFLGYDGAVRPW